MRSNRWKNRDIKQLARSGKPQFTLPVGLPDRVQAAMSAAPQTEHWRQPRFGNAKRLVFASALLVVLAVIAALALRSPDAKQTTRQTVAVSADERGRAPVAAAPSPRSAGTSTMEPAPIIAAHTGSEMVSRRPGTGTESSVRAPVLRQRQPVVVVIVARQPATDSRGHALQVGDRLPAGTTFKTGAGGRLSLISRRGSEFTLDAQSALALAADGRGANLGRGRLYCRNREHEFAVITTTAGRIELLGTVVDAAVKAKKTVAVTVVEGEVRLANAHGQALVGAGKKALLTAQLPPEEGVPANTAAETAWYDGRGAMVSDFGDIVYTVRRANGPVSEVWVMKADGTGKRRVRSYVGGASMSGPWLPGGQVVLFQTWGLIVTAPDYQRRRALTGSGGAMISPWNELWMLDAATGQDAAFELPAEYRNPWQVTQSPDLSRVVFSASRATGPDPFKDYDWGLWVYDLETGQTRKLDGAPQRSPAWSPDGTMVAASDMRDSSEGSHLMLVNVNDGTVTDPKIRGTSAAFSPDGTKIAYVDDYQGDYGDGTEISDVGRVFVWDMAANGTPQLVSPRDERARLPRWSSDGTRVLYTVGHYHMTRDGQMQNTYDVYVSAADGSWTQQVYHTDKWPRAAWTASGDAIYVATQDGIVLVAADGSGLLADLGGNEGDSLLSPAEHRQMDVAVSAIQEAAFQYAVGRVLDHEGRFAEGRTAYQTAAELFASLPWKSPLLGFSAADVAKYADAMVELAGRPAKDVETETCRAHLTQIGLLLPPYAKEHDGTYPPDLATLQRWALTKTWGFDHVLRVARPDVSAAMVQCPHGDAYLYTPPAPGTQPKAGDVLLTCPKHPDCRVTWENRYGELRPKWLTGFSFSQGVDSDPD